MADYNQRTPENYGKNSMHIVESQPQVAVVVVPFLDQGHLNPLLHLSRRISSYDIPVYYVSTTTYIRQARDRVHGWDPSAITNLHFHDIPSPPFPNLSPDSNFSSVKQAAKAMFSNFHEPLFMLVNQLLSGNQKRVIIIVDHNMGPVLEPIQSLPNVESYIFDVTSAFNLFTLLWRVSGKPDIPIEAEVLKELQSMEDTGRGDEILVEYLKSQRKAPIHSGTIFNTNKIIEGLSLDLLEKTRTLEEDKLWALGPFNPVFGEVIKDSKSRSKCLDWLDKQPPQSVIFVSFGTTSFLSNEQIRELAFGLERSEQKFIWALRDKDGSIVQTHEVRKIELLEGFEERVRERGMVVRDWAPQLEILKHTATGGFLSHCGWNSCMESISMGVPIAAWPMQWDQPANSVLIRRVLKIGVEVRDWPPRRDELVSSVKVEEAVRRLMASTEGDEMRQRAEQLAGSIKQSMMEGGEMDSFIAHINR